MNAFYFGTGRRRLFGIYESARGTRGAARAAVICNPWGSEYIYAHRSLRQLSKRLTIAGFHTLRFDYFGTGDAAGEMTEADLSGWESDIRSALVELCNITGSVRVSLLGLRLGATLAARVAVAHRDQVSSLVLWDPVVNGTEYLDQLYLASCTLPIARKQPVSRPTELGGGHEILGFPLTICMAREFHNLDLIALVPALPLRTLVVVSGAQASYDALAQALRERAAEPLTIERIASQLCWIADDRAHLGSLPVNVLNRITEWVA